MLDGRRRPDVGRIQFWVQQGIRHGPMAVAAEHGLAPAPAAATDNLILRFGDKIGLVENELPIHAKNRTQSSLHLRGRVIICLQDSNRKRDELVQFGNVCFTCRTQFPVCFWFVELAARFLPGENFPQTSGDAKKF